MNAEQVLFDRGPLRVTDRRIVAGGATLVPAAVASVRVATTSPRLSLWALAIPLGAFSGCAGVLMNSAERAVASWVPLAVGVGVVLAVFAAGFLFRPRHVVYVSAGGREFPAFESSDLAEALAARNALAEAAGVRGP